MRFSPSFLDDIRDRVPISDVIGRHVTWDRKKTNTSRGDWWACCPFHGEKSPSFHCEDKKGRYHCFGCGVSGDHFKFLTELESLNFPEAVERVADMAGISLPAPDPQAAQRERQRATLEDVMEMAAAYFEGELQGPQGAKARAYLRDRGLSGRTIAAFRLGYSNDNRSALKEHLASRGVDREQIEACGLVVHGPEISVSYDRFRDRIMFPILSSRERVIAFGGRALSPGAPAKYLNSNETELFHKGNVLYNFARARRACGQDGTLIVVEGYMDVIALAQAGIDNVVAPLGTALGENQLKLIWRITPQPVLCFDGDEAGQRAANRTVDLALPLIGPGRSLRIAVLPAGKDPDDLVRQDGRDPFDQVINSARPLADVVWSREAGAGVFETPESRAELEAKLKQTTGLIADESLRRHYQQDMRDRMQAFFGYRNREQGKSGRGNYGREGGGRGSFERGNGNGGGRPGPQSARGMVAVSERLSRSGMVRGHAEMPSLRETVLVMTVANHPQMLHDEFDELAALEFEDKGLMRVWQVMLNAASAGGRFDRERLFAALEADGQGAFIARLESQIRNARIWTATVEAASEDAREGYIQALGLHKRTRELKWQKSELERDIVECEDAEQSYAIMATLEQVQLEIARLENQEAIIDGFGVLSGRVKGGRGSNG
ncbi:DNA primase, catalytic core [Hoeflea sp. IMCC20628]|uniref:DNA primase n=1 Tax=Hoeflea sp. IMCC20628 TaxID=1620421 RepID=UPI00063AD745|nr:DNA primase [Hoeflea sp. IMCC20628]AKH99494.1 DNA primase, catalytic core [Hoeflea sp. IMCC20628]